MKLKIKLFARNIVNPEAITEFISKISKGQSDKIKIWCNTILKNYLKNEYSNLKEVTKAKKTDPTWLQEAVKRKDAQILVIDKDFERLLIEHIFHYFDTLQSSNIKHSFSEAQKQTKEWENKENLFNIKLTKGVKEILKCKNNFAWFEIIDEETLYNEGEVLQNCMRKKEHGPEYWNQIRNKNTKIFTLRDSKGVGHVGVEYSINENEIEQMVGKQNDPPIELYHSSCIELIKYLKCKIDSSSSGFLGIIVDKGKIYDVYNLPNNFKVNGELCLSGTEILKLPDDLEITDSLDISNTKINKLPKNLKIGMSLNISKTKITKLPNDLRIEGDLDISDTKISKLPNNLYIGGSLKLKGTKIKELPDNLYIGCYLDLSSSPIKLNNNLKTGESLNLIFYPFFTLPDNMEIGADLDLRFSNIMELPNNLKVGWSLNLEGTKIKELPTTLYVNRNIYISNGMKLISKNKELLKKIKKR